MRALPAILLLCLILGGCGQRLLIIHEPRFATGTMKIPSARAGYPTGDWGRPTAQAADGFDYMLRFVPPRPRPGAVVVQEIQVRGMRLVNCQGPPVPYSVPPGTIEYFKLPSDDVQQRFNVPAEELVSEARQGRVSYLALPGNNIPNFNQPKHRGQNAIILSQEINYLFGLPPAQRRLLERPNLRRSEFTRWFHRATYDGCGFDPPPSCGKKHCLDFLVTDIDNQQQVSLDLVPFASDGEMF
ncbi:MAG: hypothetical protein AAF604_12785 [Acidobacteriota bacterium]